MHKPIRIILAVCLFAAMAIVLVNLTQTKKRPNIVLIMADDIGFGDVSYYNTHINHSPVFVETPAIDALAEQGMWFTDAHSASALCSPSRYSVMSGNYPFRTPSYGGWSSLNVSPIKKTDSTLGRVAKNAGYKTAFVGKWHLAARFNQKGTDELFTLNWHRGDREDLLDLVDFTKWVEGHPEELGFTYDFTLISGVQGPYDFAYENSTWYPLSNDSILESEPPPYESRYPKIEDSAWDGRNINILLAEKASQFIQSNSDQTPFLLTYWSPAVHIPHTPPEKWGTEKIAGTTPSRHLDMVKTLDKEVESIVNALKQAGIYDNTLIIFTSDNGGVGKKRVKFEKHKSPGNLRGRKAQIYEGGHRVPFIASWPGMIKPGVINSDLVNGTDILATVAAIVDTEIQPDQAKDSWNLLPKFLNQAPLIMRSELYSLGGGKQQLLAYRKNQWKLILNEELEKIEFYDLLNNPLEDEEQNLVNHPDHQDLISQIQTKLIDTIRTEERTTPIEQH